MSLTDCNRKENTLVSRRRLRRMELTRAVSTSSVQKWLAIGVACKGGTRFRPRAPRPPHERCDECAARFASRGADVTYGALGSQGQRCTTSYRRLRPAHGVADVTHPVPDSKSISLELA